MVDLYPAMFIVYDDDQHRLKCARLGRIRNGRLWLRASSGLNWLGDSSPMPT